MIYTDIEDARQNMHWLVRECTSAPFASLKLTEYEASILEKSLESHEDKTLIEFYETIFERAGLSRPDWSNKPKHQSLPLFALVPNEGIHIVMEREADGRWKSESQKGISVVEEFPEGTLFTPARETVKDFKKISAKQMFKTIAFREKSVLMNAAIATFGINVLALGTSFFSMQVYDRVIPTQGLSTLMALGIGVCIAIFLEMILKLSKSYLVDGASVNMDLEYSHNIFTRFLKIRSDVLPKSVGTISGQLQSYSNIRAFISSASLYILIDFPFTLIFLAVIVMLAGWTIGAIIVGFMFISVIAGIFFKNKIETLSKTSTMASHKKFGLLVESVENAENVKATGAGWSLLSRWNALSEDAIYDDIEIRRYSDISTYTASMLQQLSYVSVVSMGAYLVSTTDTLTMGGLIATTILSGRVLSPISMLPNLLVQWGRTKISIEDIDNIYKLESDNEGVERPLNPVKLKPYFRCENLHFAYAENTPIVNVEKLSIKEGERVAILGAVGSGKSTLLKLLAGLYKPTQGKVYLDNIDMHQISRNRINELIGYLPQQVKLISGTLRDNLLLGLTGITDEQIIKASEETGLIQLIGSLPKGLDTPVPEGGESVSGGQKQMIALTRMLLMSPLALFLDEPTANIDEGSEKKLIRTFSNMLTSERTLIVVTHKPALLALVDRIIVINSQGIVIDGTKDFVLQKLGAKPSQKGVS
ncbi:Type I secretion system ATPase, LssB family LapB [hydrothermal vent metagenome]|uniref:Type I secretion system ATPase, LssB family LapB n=1 Tax=hydrothermal vent metagenome TaxID=652676 RepID=A0A1W1EEA0_9ZZZZ